MIEVVCPNPSCGRKLGAPDSSAGRTARCPLCGTKMTVPPAPQPQAGALELQPEAAPPSGGPWGSAPPAAGPVPAPSAPAPRSRLPLAVAAVAAVAVAGAAAFFLTRGGGPRRKGTFGTPPAIAATYQGPKIELKILMNPAVYTIVETSEDQGTQKIKAGRESQEQKTASTLRVDGVVEIKPPAAGSGERHITYKCTRVKMDQTQGPMRMSFDSEAPSPSGGPGDPASQMLAAVLGSMVGWEGVQVYSKDGEFLRLEGLEHLLSKMRAAPGGAQVVGMMKKMLEPFLRDALTRHWGKLVPTGPVAPGDSWKRTVDLDKVPMFGRLDFEFTCWLTDVQDTPGGKVAVLVCDGAARLRNREADMGDIGMPVAMKVTVEDMTLLLRQTVKFPLAVGLATEVAGDLDVDGSMTMRLMGQTAKTELQQTSKFTYTLTPKK